MSAELPNIPQRFVVPREGGGFDVIEGELCTEQPVSLEEAQAIIARKEGKLN